MQICVGGAKWIGAACSKKAGLTPQQEGHCRLKKIPGKRHFCSTTKEFKALLHRSVVQKGQESADLELAQHPPLLECFGHEGLQLVNALRAVTEARRK